MAIQAGEDTFYQAKRGIVQNGLILNLDPHVGKITTSTWESLVDNLSMTLYNSPQTTKTPQGIIANLDGSDDYMRLADTGDDFLLASAGTVECWVYVDQMGQGKSFTILGKYRHSNTNAGGVWSFKVYGSGSGGSTPSLTANGVYSSNNTYTYDEWKHCVATWSGGDGGTTTIYLDGSSLTSGTTSFSDQQQTGKPVYNSVSAGYPVKIGGYRVYNRALTAAEITQNYNATRHRFGV